MLKFTYNSAAFARCLNGAVVTDRAGV